MAGGGDFEIPVERNIEFFFHNCRHLVVISSAAVCSFFVEEIHEEVRSFVVITSLFQANMSKNLTVHSQELNNETLGHVT